MYGPLYSESAVAQRFMFHNAINRRFMIRKLTEATRRLF